MAYELKTKPTHVAVDAYIDSIESESRRSDCRVLLTMMAQATGEPATMWGPSMIGFGSYHYLYASGHQGDAMLVGFSPRKAAMSIYVLNGFEGQEDLLAKLGKHKVGKSCLHVKKLDDIDVFVLGEMVNRSLEQTKAMWPPTAAG